MPRKKATSDIDLAPVDNYPEKTDDVRSEEDTLKAEGRQNQVDQNPTYHQDFPTLDTSGPEHDPQVQLSLRVGAGLVSEESVDQLPQDEVN